MKIVVNTEMGAKANLRTTMQRLAKNQTNILVKRIKEVCSTYQGKKRTV